jgi:hypothetical protein
MGETRRKFDRALMSPGGDAAGLWKPTSPTAFRRFRMTG